MHEQEVAWVIDADYNAATSVFAGEYNEFENTSMELKWVSTDGGSLNWALSAYWQKLKDTSFKRLCLLEQKIQLLTHQIDMLHTIKYLKQMEKHSQFTVKLYGILTIQCN